MSGLRSIACAARCKNWSAVERELAELRLAGNGKVIEGFRDGDRLLGRDRMTILAQPEPITIHDLASREGIEIYVAKGDFNNTRRWRQRGAS